MPTDRRRPEGAVDCTGCAGRGSAPGADACPLCAGLGHHPLRLDRFQRAADRIAELQLWLIRERSDRAGHRDREDALRSVGALESIIRDEFDV